MLTPSVYVSAVGVCVRVWVDIVRIHTYTVCLSACVCVCARLECASAFVCVCVRVCMRAFYLRIFILCDKVCWLP